MYNLNAKRQMNQLTSLEYIKVSKIYVTSNVSVWNNKKNRVCLPLDIQKPIWFQQSWRHLWRYIIIWINLVSKSKYCVYLDEGMATVCLVINLKKYTFEKNRQQTRRNSFQISKQYATILLILFNKYNLIDFYVSCRDE